MLQKISTAEKDYYKDGFLAKTHAEEVKAPDLELNVLVGDRGRDRPGQRGGQAGHGRRARRPSPGAGRWRRSRRSRSTRPACGATSSRSTRAGSTTSTRSRSTPTSASSSPPSSTSPSSAATRTTSSIPRYDLDVCFFRAYEDGKPARPKHYLEVEPRRREGRRARLRRRPPRPDQPAEHAWRTWNTSATSRFPFSLDLLHDREAFLLEYGKQGPEQARQSKEDLFGIQNSRKARDRRLEGAAGPGADGPQGARPRRPCATGSRPTPRSKAAYGAAWDKIAAAQKVAAEIAQRIQLPRARPRLRLAPLPDRPRRSSGSPRRRPSRTPTGSASTATRRSSRSSSSLFSDAPIYPEFEKAKLAHSLAFWKKPIGRDDPIVERVLRGRSPERGRRATWSTAPSSPTSRSARRSPRGARRRSPRATTR